jgi:hypothetical protein
MKKFRNLEHLGVPRMELELNGYQTYTRWVPRQGQGLFAGRLGQGDAEELLYVCPGLTGEAEVMDVGWGRVRDVALIREEVWRELNW